MAHKTQTWDIGRRRYVPGDYFGELAMMAEKASPQTRACDVVVTSAAVVCLKLEGGPAQFRSLLAQVRAPLIPLPQNTVLSCARALHGR